MLLSYNNFFQSSMFSIYFQNVSTSSGFMSFCWVYVSDPTIKITSLSCNVNSLTFFINFQNFSISIWSTYEAGSGCDNAVYGCLSTGDARGSNVVAVLFCLAITIFLPLWMAISNCLFLANAAFSMINDKLMFFVYSLMRSLISIFRSNSVCSFKYRHFS